MDEGLMTTEQVAEYLGIAVSTLQLYRAMGTGPRYVKILRRLVRYRKSVIDEWLADQEIPCKLVPISAPNPYSA